MLSKDALATALPLVSGNDFYRPSHRFIFEAIRELYELGEPTDPVSVGEVLRRDQLLEHCGGPKQLVHLQVNTPSASSADHYARIISEHSSMRAVIRICSDAVDRAYDCPEDMVDLLEMIQAEVSAVVVPGAKLPGGLWTIEDFMDRPQSARPEWVIRGIVRDGWRVVVVAVEGFGKSFLLQQLALCAARGIHPFVSTVEIPRVNTLMIDCENPEDRLDDGFALITERMEKIRPLEPGRAWLWSQPGGINLRQRSDLAALEAVIAHVRPQLVCAGPVYKTFLSKPGESHEQVAREVQAKWDNLRTRYKFALVLEAHASKGGAGGVRSMDPEGSALWLRWSEFGLKMLRDARLNGPDENTHYQVGRFRMDRIKNHGWPDGLERDGLGLPWAARWNDSHWQEYIYDTGKLVEYPRPLPDDSVHTELDDLDSDPF